MKRAVECGYWHLYRFDPRLEEEGKNPFQMDSAAPTGNYLDFLRSERRFASMEAKFPEEAEKLFAGAEHDAEDVYKRQVQYQAINVQRETIPLAYKKLTSCIPVSYTHLAVRSRDLLIIQ